MTSVQNRRRLLNGNNFLLVLAFFIVACTATKNISNTSDTQVTPINVPEKKSSSPDSIRKKLPPVDIDENIGKTPIPSPVTGSAVNIAVILPFGLEKIPLDNYYDDTTKTLEGSPKAAVEFYLGCKLAKESFNNPRLAANVYFLDDQDDSIEVLSVLQHKPFPNVHYILGPLDISNLKQVAAYGKNHKIPVISPITNSMYVARNNPYYFNATPTIKTEYGYLIDEIRSENPGKTIEVIYDPTDSLQENISFLKSILAQKSAYPNPTIAAKYYELDWTDDIAKAVAQADTTSNREVLIYSNKESYIKAMIAKLRPVKNKLSIYVMPAVRYTKGLADIKYPHNIFMAYPYYTDEIQMKEFSEEYEETYNKKPSEIFYQGYDLMNMVFDQVSKGQSFTDIGSPLYYNRIMQSRFHFVPVTGKNDEIDYYENNNLYLFKYSGAGFVKVK